MLSGLTESKNDLCRIPMKSSSLMLLMILFPAGEEEEEHSKGK